MKLKKLLKYFMLIGALIDIAEGNKSPHTKPQINYIETKLEKIFLH